MTVQEVIAVLAEIAPLAYAEDFDNTGLLVGDSKQDVTGVLVTLDTLENVVNEAIETNCNMIVSFHPILFSGLKKITGKTYVTRVVQKAIKNDIAIFAIHTALDNDWNGVNAMICKKLGLQNRKVLLPQKGTIKKLTTYAPIGQAEAVKKALFTAGAGEIGNYSNCSFSATGEGTYTGNEHSNPVFGTVGTMHREAESMIHVTFAKHLESLVLKKLKEAHPYEEVAYEVTTLENVNQHIGMGMIAEFPVAMEEKAFLTHLKTTMNTGCVRHSAVTGKTIKTVAVLGGSGSFAIGAAKAAGADAFVTADMKYHDFFQSENQILLADIGHYESEQYTKELLVTALTKKISSFAVVLSQSNTNPISYF